MKKSRFQTGKTQHYLNTRSVGANVDVEMVTDDTMLVMVTVDVSKMRVDNAAWAFAHAVDVVALFLEERLGHPFSAFTVTFTAAWGMVNARKKGGRKRSAKLPALPPFLGGSEEPPKE